MLRIGSVTLSTNLLLAPIAGYCDLAFRHIVRRMTDRYPGAIPGAGVGLACTDLLCPEAIIRQTDTTKWLAATDAEDRPVCMQLYGSDGAVMAQAAQWAQSQGAALIDINMGCPVDKVTKKNGGSKLLCDPCATADIARQIVRAVSIPVTAKIRLGWDDDQLIHTTLPTQLADVGVAAVTVHGRTTAMKFRGSVRIDDIARTVEMLGRHHPDVPVIGNGDVKTPEDARAMLDRTGCAGVMIGRGAIGCPWIFRDTAHYLATGEHPQPITRLDAARILLEHFEELHRLRGDARAAMSAFRQHMPRYSAALQPWPGLRRDMHTLREAEAFRDYMHEGIDRIERGLTPGRLAAEQEAA